ncbi:MAG: fused MFS/spermidine synthase, partial [Acidobacteriales bacterium]|nr:fused MFS/spermidine synthase [Terriglobales bacterium]
GLNTIGAAAGAFAAGFFLIERFGLSGTLAVAVSVNIGIALLSWLVSLRSHFVKGSPEFEVESRPHPAVRPELGLVIYTFSGFVSLGLEVAWSRTLVFSIGSTTYAFSAVLVIVLSGLAIGSLLAAPLLKRTEQPLLWLALGQASIATLTISCLWLFDNVSIPMRDWLRYTETLPWAQRVLIQFAQGAVLLLPSAILFGATFPLSADIYLPGSKAGARIGRLLGANTFAAIGGSLFTGFLFIPALGIQRTYAVLGSVAFLALIYSVHHAFARRTRRATVAVLLGGWSLLVVSFADRHILEPLLPTQKLLFYKEGINGTISVVEDISGDRNLLIDNIAVAGTDPIFMTDQKSLAHLPMLLHPNPKRALTVGFGS